MLTPLNFVVGRRPMGRRRMLQGAAAFSAGALLSSCAANLSSLIVPTTNALLPEASTDPQPTPAGPFVPASLTVSANSVGAVGPGFAGLSYEKSSLAEPLFTPANANLIALFQLLGPSVLRIGGNSVDQTVWVPDGPGQTAGQVAPSDVAALAAFLKAAGWQCIYGINLGGAATGATTPALAAAEVAFAAGHLGTSLLGIEIGNECDGYGASYFDGNWSLPQFVSLWDQYRSAILAVTPGVPFTGPASAGNESSWTVPFAQAVTRGSLAMLTQHYYRGNGQSASATAANLVSPDTNLPQNLASLNSGAQSIGIPYRIAECNSYYNGGAPGVSNAYASALWVIDLLFACVQGGAAGVNLHGGGDWTGYTPIADSSGAIVEARPEFYGIVLFTLAGQGTLYQTALSAGPLNVSAYAVKTPDSLNLIVINKDPSYTLELTAQLPFAAATATVVTMTQSSSPGASPSLSATSGIAIQGSAITNSAAFAPSAPSNLLAGASQISFYVPALTAALIHLS